MNRQADDSDAGAERKPAGPAQGAGSSRRRAPSNLPVALDGEILGPGVRSAAPCNHASAAFVTQLIASLQREETQRDRRVLAPGLASARYADIARLGRLLQEPSSRLSA